jgi:hypothetical protein
LSKSSILKNPILCKVSFRESSRTVKSSKKLDVSGISISDKDICCPWSKLIGGDSPEFGVDDLELLKMTSTFKEKGLNKTIRLNDKKANKSPVLSHFD